MDENHKITNGVTEATRYQGSRAGYSYRLQRPDNTVFAGDSNTAFSFFFIAPAGFNYKAGTFTWKWTLSDLPDNRVKVETIYTTGVTATWSGGPLDGRGTRYVDDNTEVTFNAPEFIYLKKTYTGSGNGGAYELLDGDESEQTDVNYAWYRARNVGYSINGQAVQGTERFFKRAITENITVVWKWELEYAVVIKSATDTNDDGGGDFGSPEPAIGRHWIPQNSSQTFSAKINSVINNDNAGFRFRTRGYQMRTPSDAVFSPNLDKPLNPIDALAATDPIVVTEPMVIKWLWDGEVAYRFHALGGDQGGENQPGQSFLSIDGGTPILDSGSSVEVDSATGVSTYWIKTTSESVKFGAFYRTSDRCFTLGDFGQSPNGDLANRGTDISALSDEMVNGQWARTWTIATVESPTKISWRYVPTVFRAAVPLGQALDRAAPVLVPALCDGAKLHENGPRDGSEAVGEIPTGGPLA
ncbi:MAG: hypothetical protein ACKVJU_14540, partial [Verrucomicrobiales bacterium]